MNRREFIGQSVCFGMCFAAGAGGSGVPSLGKERLRFGVLSDIHITTEAQLPYFEKTLRALDAWKADAVLVSGDLADFAMEVQLKLVADTWFKVFPGGRGADGREVVNLLHYGDHDMQDDRYVDNAPAVKRWPDRDFRHGDVMFTHDRKASWERCFREPWAPIVCKEVKGYPFVLSHFTRGEPGNPHGNNVPGLAEFLKARTFDPRKPVFYSQHRIPRNTVCGKEVYGQDDGRTTEILSGYPNLMAFCGHAHVNGVYEKSIWQGAFTCVQVPSLRYCTTMAGRENGYNLADRKVKPAKCMRPMGSSDCCQGFLCRVHDDAVVLERRNFATGGRLGPDWVVPIASFAQSAAERPFAYDVRAKGFPVPEFAPGAKVRVLTREKGLDRGKVEHLMTPVEFPPVCGSGDRPRADDYEVALETRTDGAVRILARRRVYSPRYIGDEAMDAGPVRCLFPEGDFPKTGEMRFTVRPCNAFGAFGGAIASEWFS